MRLCREDSFSLLFWDRSKRTGFFGTLQQMLFKPDAAASFLENYIYY